MTRPIKFRAWDKEAKEYYYDAEYTYDFQCSRRGCNAESFGEILRYPERYEVEQYTGLKDKNGEEIYEGDIIESWYLNGDGNGGYYDAGNFEVVFKNGAFGVMRKESFYTFDEIEWDEVEDMVVISNIHENPELLEDDK